MPRRPLGFTMIELVVVVAIISVLIALLLPAVQAAREAARRVQCANNLVQLGIAIENYEATNQVLPPGVVDRSGPIVETPTSYQFGWIARVLPYLEQKNVYNRLNFDAGVYQPANLTGRGVSLHVLLCPSDSKRPVLRNGLQDFGEVGGDPGSARPPQPATTAYAACHNDAEAPIDVGNSGVFFLNSRVRLDEVDDGLAYTLFLGEKRTPGDELGWASGTRATLRNTGTKINGTNLDPADLSAFLDAIAGVDRSDQAREVDASPSDPVVRKPAPVGSTTVPVGGFGSYHPDGANFLFGDGSVRYVRSNLDERIFRRLATRAGGELIGNDQF